jgi:hypothetical protein
MEPSTRDDRGTVFHLGQWDLLSGNLVNVCDGSAWTDPVDGAPNCSRCAATMEYQLRSHLPSGRQGSRRG